jgi:MFS transporter, UMF1 family
MNDRREIFGWTMYDWASSAFSTTVVTAFLGPYLTALAETAADANELVYVLGIPIRYDSFFAYCVSISVALQIFVLPILGAFADYSHLRKRMLFLFSTLGAITTVLMFFITSDLWLLGGVLFIIANWAFGASVVFYNAYLPDIASKDQRDSVSSRGFALGYLGGGILLFLNLILFSLRERLGIDSGLAARICISSAGLWWLGFSLITFNTLRPRHAIRQLPPSESFLTIGFKQLGSTLHQLGKFPQTLRYLLAYLIYNDGIQTVIVIATIFASVELSMSQSDLILVILMVQAVAFVGAFIFNFIAARIGTKRAIILSLTIWSAVAIYASAFLQTIPEFWVLAAVVGTVLGGSQALSRSLFSQMIPPGREAEFFSFYEISDRFTSTLGPLVFGLANQITGSFRLGILSIMIFFIVGIIIFITVNVPRAIREAETAQLQEVSTATA